MAEEESELEEAKPLYPAELYSPEEIDKIHEHVGNMIVALEKQDHKGYDVSKSEYMRIISDEKVFEKMPEDHIVRKYDEIGQLCDGHKGGLIPQDRNPLQKARELYDKLDSVRDYT